MELNKVPNIAEFNTDIICNDEVIPLKDAIDKKKLNCDRFSCGYKRFDDAMKKGFKGGDLVIISGVSGQGKTTVAQSLTYNFCKNNIPCLWFSYEVSLEHLHSKFTEMGINDFYQVFVPKQNTSGKLEWIKSKIRESKRKADTQVIFIDHIDFLTPSSVTNSDNQAIALKKITTELKTLAIELDVVIVTMAHLKKLEGDREPEMQDIGYSAGIFQLPDYVILIHREKNKSYKGFESENQGSTYTNNSIIKYVKNRETGELPYIKCQLINQRFIEIDDNQEPPILTKTW